MIQDEVLFTWQWATIATFLHREIGRMLKHSFDITYLAFCLLASVRSHGGRMMVSEFPRDALANANTVVSAANDLSCRGYVDKARDIDDGRFIWIGETKEGSFALEEGFDAAFAFLSSTVWRHHTRENIDQTMHEFPGVVAKLGIDPIEMNNRCHPVITPSYLMCIPAFLRSWGSTVSSFSGLSFAEYRCLSLLEHRIGSLSCATVAEELMLDRSSVSPLVSRLAERGYVEKGRGGDGRKRMVSLTDKGKVAAALITAKLENVTAEWFTDACPANKAKANELHMRMFASYLE